MNVIFLPVMTMSEHSAIDFHIDEMALTDRDLFSLYLKYPEMQHPDHDFQVEDYADSPNVSNTASSPASSPQRVQVYSSPLANLTRYETPTSSPLGPPDIVPFPALAIADNEQEIDGLTAQFDLTLKSDEIPNDTAEYLAEMKSVLVMMGAILFSASGELSTNLDNVERVKSAANWLIVSLKQALDAVEEEITAIESVIELAPFTIRPAPEDLWTNYKQMAELIIQWVKFIVPGRLPSKTDVDSGTPRSLLQRYLMHAISCVISTMHACTAQQ